jgi:type 1 glutamine amidotransferase/mono/diheme cytochrome c family protein
MLRTACALACLLWVVSPAFAQQSPKKIVLIAGKKSHGPEGNGIHDYPWSVKLLKVMLDNSNVAGQVKVEYHLDGFPKDSKTLEDADSILVISDGRDGDLYEEAPHFANPENLALIQRQVQRGCGFAVIHFSTFGPDQFAPQSFEWTGGYFDWEEEGKRKWYSAIETRDAEVTIAAPEHPVLCGVQPFKMKEEFYFNIRFAEGDKSVTPLWQVTDLPGRDDRGKVVAWAKERPGGGRGFGTTCGHFYANWEHEEFRTLILNALAWTAGIDPPKEGVKARYYTRNEISVALSRMEGAQRAVAQEKPIRVLMLAGNEAHAWHNWKKTAPAITAALEIDPRIQVDISNDPEIFATDSLAKYDVIVQNNYANWHDGKPLSDKARVGFADFISKGKGLILVHFANGAWNFSLPMAGESDWPEYRKITRRVWNHVGKGEAQSGHDAFGRFSVTPTKLKNDITTGLTPFELEDELYYKQDGAEPIEPLITAKSKDTQREEPLAWTYRYGEGRVFQTLLGHSEKTYEVFAPREMLRRAVAWTAGQPPMILEERIEAQLWPPKPVDPPPAAAPALSKKRLVEGKFGKALNGASGGVLLSEAAELRDPPLTIDAWVKLDKKDGFNILVASEEKTSASHWELYTYAGSGVLSVYLPGRGGEYKSERPIVDGNWHHVALQLAPEQVALFVDGQKVLDSSLKGAFGGSKPAPVAIGRLVEGGIGCEGLIDEVRFRKGVLEIGKPASQAARPDDATLLLFHFDELVEGKHHDASPAKRHESLGAPPADEAKKSTDAAMPKEGHWSHKGVGFGWQESDSADDRWKHTNHGRHLASILPLASGTIAKGLTLRLGPKMELTAAYDTQRGELRAVWTGGFLKFDPARYGIIAPPRPEGAMQLEPLPGFGWGDLAGNIGNPQFKQMAVNGPRVRLDYLVSRLSVSESPWTTTNASGKVGLVREFVVGPQPIPFVYWITDQGVAETRDGAIEFKLRRKGRSDVTMLAVGKGLKLARTMKDGRELLGVETPVDLDVHDFQLHYGFENPPSLEISDKGPPPKKSVYKTHGVVGTTDSALAIDRIPLPFENADKALLFVTGHDFIEPGKMAISTLHGDIWLVEGVDEDLDEITWTRFATGLFQPLGLVIKEEEVHVLGRDQITRLADVDEDGVADLYICTSNRWDTPTGGHDYATCLELDSQGNFYFLDAVKGVQKVSADGADVETIATGLRNPNGMGMSPRNEITVAPQEGEWTPASFVAYARPGDHFGYLGPKISADRPLGLSAPLLYLSRRIDNSCGGQVWVPQDTFGPLAKKMLHLSFGQCRILPVYEEVVNGVRQAGAVSLPIDFDSGIMRGRFSPYDGALYVSGSRGWVTRAAQDGCLTRVRYTDQPLTEAPANVESRGNGFEFTFDAPLDRRIASDPGSYRVETWNYHYSAAYGSRDFKVSSDSEEGRDEIEVLSATLSEDGKTLSLRTPPLKPAHQVQIEYRLRTREGKPLKQSYLHTLHAVRSELFPEAPAHNALADAGLTKDSRKKLQPGLAWTFTTENGKSDVVTRRLAALSVEHSESPTHFLRSGAFTATTQGWLVAPFSDEYAFEIQGYGEVSLTVGGKNVWSGEFASDLPAKISNVRLTKGYNPISLIYKSRYHGAGALRVLWKGEGFPAEPLPPTALFHLPSQVETNSRREGLQLFAEHLCIQCHVLPELTVNSREALRNWFAAPLLEELPLRLKPDWVAAWIANPSQIKPNARMPHLLGNGNEKGKVKAESDAADLTAFLFSNANTDSQPAPQTDDSRIAAGARLYETLGCVSCHRQTPASQVDPHDRVSLHLVANKFTPAGLSDFIKNPQARAPASRMPDFGLSEDEAHALADYLMAQTPAEALPKAKTIDGNPDRGRKLHAEHRCADCHIKGPANRQPIALSDLSRGCLSKTENGSLLFDLTPNEKAAITSMLESTDHYFLSLESPADNNALLTRVFRCTNCHDRDHSVAPRRALIEEEGDSGQPAPVIPNLTWTGDKLRTKWLKQFLAAQSKVPTRPWLAARMPRFPLIAEPLAKGFAAEHGIMNVGPFPVERIDQEKAKLGAALAAQNQLDCRQCHAIGDLQPRGDDKSQIALGINFALTRDRIHPDFFDRFVLDPPRYDVGTRMPKLADEGRTRAVDILSGDAEAQFDALWHFIRSIPDASAAGKPSP